MLATTCPPRGSKSPQGARSPIPAVAPDMHKHSIRAGELTNPASGHHKTLALVLNLIKVSCLEIKK